MSCPHAETTALLAVFDEAPPGFETHLTECAECIKVVQDHIQTLSILTPALSSTSPVHTNTKSWTPPTMIFLLAAAILLIIQLQTPPVDSGRLEIDSLIHNSTSTIEINPFESLLDSELESLEMELALLHLESS